MFPCLDPPVTPSICHLLSAISHLETDQLGKLTDGAYTALNRITQRCINKVGNEQLARMALGAAALHGQIFCDEVVANVLWRVGLRLADQYTSKGGHVEKVSSLFNDQMCDLVTDARLESGRHFHRFRSILFRYYAKSDIPSEKRKLLREFTAAALEQIFTKEIGQYGWLVIALYEESGQLEHAQKKHEEFTRPPLSAAQEWELQSLSEKIRAVSTDTNWAAWAISVCNRLNEVNAVKGEISRLLDEVIMVTTISSEIELHHEAILTKVNHLHSQGLYLEAYDLAADLFGIYTQSYVKGLIVTDNSLR